MILTPHILIGAIIGSKISSPPLIFILSFLSHYFLDMLPHYEYKISGLKHQKIQYDRIFFIYLSKISIDFLIGMGLALWLIWDTPTKTLAIIGMVSALIPDGLLFLYWRLPDQPILKFFAVPHRACHFLKRISPNWLGIAVEIIIIIAAVIFLAQPLFHGFSFFPLNP